MVPMALKLAMAVEDLVGVPQDVEWAADGDDVYVVQARPITVLEQDDGFDTPIDDHERMQHPPRGPMITHLRGRVTQPILQDLGKPSPQLIEAQNRLPQDPLGIPGQHPTPGIAQDFIPPPHCIAC